MITRRVNPIRPRPVSPMRSRIRGGGGGGNGGLAGAVSPSAVSSFTDFIAKGAREDVSPFRVATVFGADLNTPNLDNWNAPPTAASPVTTYDVSIITINHEVILFVTIVHDITPPVAIQMDWWNVTTGENIFNFAYNVTQAYTWAYAYSYIGWLTPGHPFKEINMDGGYFVTLSLNTAVVDSKNFTVVGTVQNPPPTPTISDLAVDSLSR